MASAKANALPSFTPQEVADAFLRHYYRLLRDSPAEIHKLYLDSSMVSRVGADGVMTCFTTKEQIEKNVLSCMDCKEYDIISCDIQTSATNMIFVMVVGCFTTKNDEITKFSQSFILAPMEVKGYFVSNDILRFLDKQETNPICNEEAPTDFSTSSTSDDDVPEQVVPKKSYLSVVNALIENNAPFKAPPVKKFTEESNIAGKSRLEGKKNTRNTEDVKRTTIFVGNLGMDSDPEQLYEAFKIFGPIKCNGVKIRTDKHNRFFAFVQFESSGSAQRAIKASFIRTGNRKLNIEGTKRNDLQNRKFSQVSVKGNGNGNGNGTSIRSGSWKFHPEQGPSN